MKSYKLLIITAFISISVTNYAQKPLYAFFNYLTFYSPSQNNTYIETYLTVIGSSTIFKQNENKKFQSTVEITMLFKQDGKIKDFKKINLNSPEIDDTTKSIPNFIDQQRFTIPSGIYNFELLIGDLNDTSNNKKYKFHDIFDINIDTANVDISGIELLEKYDKTVTQNIKSKSGYDLIPYVSNFYPENINKLIFYSEIYNTDLKKYNGEDFLVKYYIEKENNKTILGEYNRFKKQKAAKVTVVLSEFNIENLPSGNYNLVIEAKNKNNDELKIKKIGFQRSNPKLDIQNTDISTLNTENTFVAAYTNTDTLVEYLSCIRPIADRSEKIYIDNQIKGKKVEFMQKFFLSFWLKRNETNPEKEWYSYYQQVMLVNSNYTTVVKKGYETDQGRVFLQYGPPNDINGDKHDPSAYPYEIWQYEKINDQTNRRFVFYCSDLTGRDYSLLHSDVKGEISIKNWELVLHKRDNPIYNFDETTGKDYYGGRSLENFSK